MKQPSALLKQHLLTSGVTAMLDEVLRLNSGGLLSCVKFSAYAVSILRKRTEGCEPARIAAVFVDEHGALTLNPTDSVWANFDLPTAHEVATIEMSLAALLGGC